MKRRWSIILCFFMAACISKKYVKFTEYQIDQNARDLAYKEQDKIIRHLLESKCSQDMRQTLADLDQGCKMLEAQTPGKSGQHQCDAKLIPGRITEYLQRHGSGKKTFGGFLLDLMKLEHAVVYLSNSTKELPDDSQKRLRSLLAEPTLKTTQYLLISSAEIGEELARKRINIVRDWMFLQGQVSPENLQMHELVYYFFKGKNLPNGLKEGDLPQEDRPVTGREPPDLHMSVWIFRIDCLLSLPQVPAPAAPAGAH